MKKTLLILIILFTNIFSQDILITMKGTEYKGEFISKTDNSILFKAERMLNAQNIQIETIESLILADGTAVIKNGYFIEDGESLKDGKKITPSTIGGSLIGLTGVLMYSMSQREFDSDLPSGEERYKKQKEYDEITKSYSELSYVLLAVGGFLIAIDNN